MNEYRQYIIGGPLDGKQKGEEFPDIPDWGVIRSIEFTGDELGTYDSTETRPLNIEWNYRQDRFTFGGITVYFWTDHRLVSREIIAMHLAELIMAPHLITTPQKETEGTPQ